jgi:hypothetical protein
LPGDEGGQSNSQVREFLQRAVQALEGLSASCRQTLTTESLEPIGAYEDFVRMLERDAQNSLAAIRIVLAQPSISSQLVDNLNASIHLRALLTDLFLIGEVLQTRSAIPSSQS